jgi:DNA polymerase (family 10)
MNLDDATAKAIAVADQLRPFCAQIEIAGSIRRRRPQPGDLDFVIQPLPGKRRYIRDRCLSWKPQVLTDGQVNLLLVVKGVQLDIFFADEPGADLFAEPGNFGSLLVCRTGSLEFNKWLCGEAKKRGLHWNPQRGVVQKGKIIASHTEEAVFKALGLSWIKPEEREKYCQHLTFKNSLRTRSCEG